jgi:hypothetical protein
MHRIKQVEADENQNQIKKINLGRQFQPEMRLKRRRAGAFGITGARTGFQSQKCQDTA